MTPEESFEIEKSKGYLVVKSNDLIQRNRFELSLPEQKTVAYICSIPCIRKPRTTLSWAFVIIEKRNMTGKIRIL